MNTWKKIANQNHEEVACMTSRHTSRHGVSKGIKRSARKYNKAARRIDARWHFASQ